MPRFYLNYVGCKEIEKAEDELTKMMFYLNYVGCKVLYSLLKLVLCI